MNKHRISFLSVLAAGVLISGLLGGCDALKVNPTQEPETQAQTQAAPQTEAPAEKPTEKVTEKVTEPPTEALIQNVLYTSQDHTVSIVLPDSTWKVTQDADEMRVFSSGAAMINIVHAATESELKRMTVYESEEELEESLTRQYPEANAFEIQSFEGRETDYLDTYEYVVKYNSKSMWAYAVTYGILAQDEAYLVTGTVTDDNKTMLEAVQKSVETFTVLANPKFQIPETEPETEAAAMTPQPQTSAYGDADADAELSSLNIYRTPVKKSASDDLNVRIEPSRNAEIIDALANGDVVTVTGETPQWYRVQLGETTGFVIREFMKDTAAPASSPAQTSGETSSSAAAGAESEKQSEQQNDSADVDADSAIQAEYYGEVRYDSSVTYFTNTEVNIRTEPGTDAAIVDGLGSGLPVEVIGETDNWYVVQADGLSGYIMKNYLSSSFEEDVVADDVAELTDESAKPSDAEDSSEVYEDETNASAIASGGTVSGTVLSADAETIRLQGDDGKTYVINYSKAAVSGDSAFYEGLYISAEVLPDADGNVLTASSITEY